MALQSSFYNTDGSTRTFPSTKHIATKQHVSVYKKRLADNVWVIVPVEDFSLINNSIVFDVAPDTAVYSQIEVRVADTANELEDSPSDIALVAGAIANINSVAADLTNIDTVATNIASVQTTSANTANINTVATNIANVNTTGSNIASVNTNATNIADIVSVADTVVPNIAEILLADDNAAIATAQAGIATTQAGIATTQATNASNSATAAATSASEAAASAATLDLTMAIGNINSPLFDMPLKNSLAMKSGVGSATFTRASTATYIDRYGVLKTAAIDEPRFEKEGYLNEGASTNLCLYSQDFSNVAWSTGSVNEAITSEVTSPDGTNNSTKLTPLAGITSVFIQQSVTVTDVVPFTLSFFVKKGTDRYIIMNMGSADDWSSPNPLAIFDLDTGAWITSSWNENVVALSNGWFRISITATKTSAHTSPYFRLYMSDTTSTTRLSNTLGTEYTYIFGAQLEALPFATSYIPTVASTVTRSADNLSITSTYNMPLFNASISVDFIPKGILTSDQRILMYCSESNVTTAFVLGLNSSDNNMEIYVDGVQGLPPMTATPNTKYRWTVTGGVGQLQKRYSNGTLVNTSGSHYHQTTVKTALNIGNQFNTTSYFYGHITNVRMWQEILTAQEVALA